MLWCQHWRTLVYANIEGAYCVQIKARPNCGGFIFRDEIKCLTRPMTPFKPVENILNTRQRFLVCLARQIQRYICPIVSLYYSLLIYFAVHFSLASSFPFHLTILPNQANIFCGKINWLNIEHRKKQLSCGWAEGRHVSNVLQLLTILASSALGSVVCLVESARIYSWPQIQQVCF